MEDRGYKNEFRRVWASVKTEAFSTRIFFDPLAIPLTALFAKMRGITPNKVSLCSLVLGLCAAAAFASGRFALGALGYYLFFLFDSIDGKLARLSSTFDPLGTFYDFSIDRIVLSSMLLGYLVALYHVKDSPTLLLLLIYALLFLLKDTLDLKWKEAMVSLGVEERETAEKISLLSRYKIHFKPGQTLSCFTVFFIAPLTGNPTICFVLGILFVCFSIAANVLLPFVRFLCGSRE